MLACHVLSLIISTYTVGLSASIQWPAGSYGIPKATSGCSHSVGFQWASGWRYQDTESESNRSSPFHLDGKVDNKGVNRSFCIKTDTRNDTNRSSWPTGKYCVYKKGACPTGMTSGYVEWDDVDKGNSNKKGGTLPDGLFNVNTKIDFCCRTNGNKKDPVPLPASTPFYLLAYESPKCQQVKWALVSVEWILYSNEDYSNSDYIKGAYPYGAGIKKNHHKIHYCYYQGCNKTLNSTSGTFHSPNYPQRYPDGQHCSWRITIKPTHRVHLTFTHFTLQTGNNTDSVHVYNGENESGEGLEVFYGGHPPPREGIYSSSNQVFVIFKSDSVWSFTGFNASYFAVNHSEPTTTATSVLTTKIASSNKEPTTTATSTLTTEMTSSTKEPIGISSSTPSFQSISGVEAEGGVNKDRTGNRTGGLRGGVIAAVIVVPLVVFILLALLGFVYFRRRKTRKEKDDTLKVCYESSSSLPRPAMSVDNPAYDRSMVSENVLYSSREDEGILYTEAKGEDSNSFEPNADRENENPLYEAMSEGNAESNPIYDSSS